MKKIIILLATIFPVLIHAATFTNNQTLHFKNQRGSTLNITFHETAPKAGTLTGTFTTAVASKTCLDIIGKPQPITGFYTGDVISISVSYPTCGAAIAFVGNFDNQNNIQTLWLDAHQGEHPDKNDWNARLIGSDLFTLTSDNTPSNNQKS